MNRDAKLMLSADGDVMLYEVEKSIINNFDNILEDFYNQNKTKNYDEQLFVEYLQKRFGSEAIKFIRNLGCFDYDNIPNEYENIKWYNF